MRNKIKINTFADESGQDTEGRMFVVASVITEAGTTAEIASQLCKLEKDSGKVNKWSKSSNKRRSDYLALVLKEGVLTTAAVYYSIFENKKEYVHLIGSHLAKAILQYVGDKDYEANIFLDKVDKHSIFLLRKDIKDYRIKYSQIRGLNDKSSSIIRLADAVCGLVRDFSDDEDNPLYESFTRKIRKI